MAYPNYRSHLRILSIGEDPYWIAMIHNMVRCRRGFTSFYSALIVSPDGSVNAGSRCMHSDSDKVQCRRTDRVHLPAVI